MLHYMNYKDYSHHQFYICIASKKKTNTTRLTRTLNKNIIICKTQTDALIIKMR